MLRSIVTIIVAIGSAVWVLCFPPPLVLAASQGEDNQGEVASTEAQGSLPRVLGKIVDQKGKGIAEAWMSIAFTEDPSIRVNAPIDDTGAFKITNIPADASEGLWKIGNVGADGYLPVTFTVEQFDSGGTSVERSEIPEFTPEVPMPTFRVAPNGRVEIRVVMGEKTEVAARWTEARQKARAAEQQEQGTGASGAASGASASWAAGNKKFAEQDYVGALADYDAALESVPDDPALLSAKASVLFRLDRYEEARQVAEEALRAGGQDIRLLLTLADRFGKAGDSANARAVLKLLLEVAPENVEVHVQSARLNLQEGDVDAAVASYREATSRSPEDPKLWSEMANACRKAGAQACAAEAYGALVKLDPAFDRAAYYFLGTLTEGPKAIEYFEKASAYIPEAHIKLCVAYRNAEEIERAIASCRAYLEAKPEGAEVEQVKALLQSLEP